MSKQNLSTIEEKIKVSTTEERVKAHRDNVKSSVPFYSWRKRKQLLEHFDRTVALYEGTVGIMTAAWEIERSARSDEDGGFEKALKTAEVFSEDRLVQLIKNCPESRLAFETMTLVDSVSQEFDSMNLSDSLMTCLETYQEHDLRGFDQITEPIKRSLHYRDEESTQAVINLISGCVGKEQRFDIVDQCISLPNFLYDSDNYKKAIGLLDSYKDHVYLENIITLLRNTIDSLSDKDVLDLVVDNLEKYKEVKHDAICLANRVANLLGIAINVGKRHNYDGSFDDDKFRVDAEDLRSLMEIVSAYDDNKAKLRKVINFSDHLISRTHNLKFSNSVVKELENYSELQSFRFNNILSTLETKLGVVSREIAEIEELDYLPKALALPEVVKTMSKCTGAGINVGVLLRISEAILYTAAVCPEEETVSRVAKMLRNGVDIVKKTAITEAERIISLARNYRKYPKGFQAATKVLESYLSSHNFGIAIEAINQEYKKFSLILRNPNYDKDDIIRHDGPLLEKSVKKLEALASPKVKEFLDERLDWPNRVNLGSFISGCYSDGVSLDHITQVAENLKPYLEIEDCEIILNPLEEALCVSNGSTFWDKVSVQGPDDVIERICSNLTNSSAIEYFESWPHCLGQEPVALAIAWGDSSYVKQVVNLLNGYSETFGEIQKAVSDPLTNKIKKHKKQGIFSSDEISKVSEILTRPKIVERIKEKQMFYQSCSDAVKAMTMSACETGDQELVDIISDYVHSIDLNGEESVDYCKNFSNCLIELLNKGFNLGEKTEITKVVAKHLTGFKNGEDMYYLGAVAFSTALKSEDLNLTKYVAKFVDKYKEKKGCNLITEVLLERLDKSNIDSLDRALKLFSLSEFEDFVNIYQDKPSNITELAIKVMTEFVNKASELEVLSINTEQTKNLTNQLIKYNSHIHCEKILEVFDYLKLNLVKDNGINDVSNFVDNCPDIQRINNDHLGTYFNNIIEYFTDEEFKFSLTAKNVSNIIAAYDLTESTCDSWDRKARDQALKGFGNVLNI